MAERNRLLAQLDLGPRQIACPPAVLRQLDGREGLNLKHMSTTYFLGRETLVPSAKGSGMAVWRERIFAFMSHNARSPATYFRLPPNQVVELGARIEL